MDCLFIAGVVSVHYSDDPTTSKNGEEPFYPHWGSSDLARRTWPSWRYTTNSPGSRKKSINLVGGVSTHLSSLVTFSPALFWTLSSGANSNMRIPPWDKLFTPLMRLSTKVLLFLIIFLWHDFFQKSNNNLNIWRKNRGWCLIYWTLRSIDVWRTPPKTASWRGSWKRWDWITIVNNFYSSCEIWSVVEQTRQRIFSFSLLPRSPTILIFKTGYAEKSLPSFPIPDFLRSTINSTFHTPMPSSQNWCAIIQFSRWLCYIWPRTTQNSMDSLFQLERKWVLLSLWWVQSSRYQAIIFSWNVM